MTCLERLTKLAGWFGAPHVRNTHGALTSEKYIRELIQYLRANRCALVNYGHRRHARLPISTAFVESAVNEIVSKRMIKKQQMRWNRWTVQPFLDVRTAVLNGTLQGSFKRRYPAFRIGNDNHFAQLAARDTPRSCMLSSRLSTLPATTSKLRSGRRCRLRR